MISNKNNMKKSYLIIKSFAIAALCLVSANVMAQQEAMYSQYMFNMMSVNPAYAGSRDVLSATGLYRQNWVGIAGAPTTQTITMDAPLSRERIGVGFQAFNDQVGEMNSTGFYATYAFRVKVSQKATLSLGLQAGATNFRANFSLVLHRLHRLEVSLCIGGTHRVGSLKALRDRVPVV